MICSVGLGAPDLPAQIPDSFTNLRVLPKDITRDSLVQIMRGFSLSLEVRCQYCHVGGNGVSFEGVEFAKDDDPDKVKARFMLRMVDSLNRVVLPGLPGRSEPPIRLECKTCHRGAARPYLLTQLLERVRDSAGIEAAVARYRDLRRDAGMAGRYDFGEWEVNQWAERLAKAGRAADAIAVYQLNLEFFPQSGSILAALGQLHEPIDRAKAIEYYERLLIIAPRNAAVLLRLERIKADTGGTGAANR
jgi:tetratricopeptide (TPR) repeat protein